jgi:hypothetical protein
MLFTDVCGTQGLKSPGLDNKRRHEMPKETSAGINGGLVAGKEILKNPSKFVAPLIVSSKILTIH